MMTDQLHNRLRQLQGLITIDAWHGGEVASGAVDLHAYIHFDEARLGGQAGDEIAFRMHLKRAELKLLQSEPKSYHIDPSRIWRGDQDTSGRVTRTSASIRSSAGRRGGSAAISKSPEFKLEGGQDRSQEDEERVESEFNESTRTIRVSFSRIDRDQPLWVFSPGHNAPVSQGAPILSGQPWDDKSQRLLSLDVNTKHESDEMLSSLRLCIICRREDLQFFDIMTREKDGEFYPVADDTAKRLVIQEYLRSVLSREGLPSADMTSPFAIIHLGEAVSEHYRRAKHE